MFPAQSAVFRSISSRSPGRKGSQMASTALTQKEISTHFPGCFLANIILFFGMLTTNRPYIDDIGRSMRGYSDWGSLGARPLADLFITLLNFGTPLVNTFPLPQIISICIVSVAGIYLAKAFSIQSRLMVPVCTLPLAGQPYFLENMSYSFDSPFMALSLFLAVAAAIQLFGKGYRKTVYSVIMLFCALNLYQATLGVFCVIWLFLLIKNIESEKRPARYLARSLGKVILAGGGSYLLYIPVLKILTLSVYVQRHDKIIGLDNGYSALMGNIAFYFETLYKDWSVNVFGLIFVALFMLTVVLSVIRIVKSAGDTSRGIVCAGIAAIILPMTWLAAYFPQFLLEKPQWSPRTFTGIGAILSCSCLYCYAAVQHTHFKIKSIYLKHIVSFPVFVLAFALITFAYAFTKANTEQMYYEDAILTRIADDIQTIDYKSDLKFLSYIGQTERNPLLLNTQRKFPLIARLVPIHLMDNWIWGYRQMTYEGISNLAWKKITEDDKAFISKNLSPVITNTKYSIYLRADQIIIHFHESR
jgi:hypothetical protein